MATHLTRARLHTTANTRFQSPRFLGWSAPKPLSPLLRYLPGTGHFPQQLSAQLVFNQGSAYHTFSTAPTILPYLVFTLHYCNPGGNFRLVQT